MYTRYVLSAFILSIFFFIEINPQDNSLGFPDEKFALINSNDVTIIFYNTGSFSRPIYFLRQATLLI
ncbi:MAG: hypothetical protein A2315_09480 [Ignavibacteria bacterium RIFOXYB2_FULL_35_12]|nr:MAG: hypothetical protein A2058_10745 [Ignavibacteria bacterium GWA2_36_19]OGU54074.1 MAG: hypothetical protein A2006_08520 [Ignavibacteria bacterium GWC2_35_8]OGU62516.1 MAG: hypothetical protein A2X60_18005 [Ignavibacteria bacterium GWF2_35_20]OGU81748.1 MAG: hypothetical protein A2254_11420 [Ignavibacteria bacterium RIFOXYA2_FULL_35_9]OGU87574.1 MAG: hypothetical protein A3K31_03650 [Ignavibacteria bacterium RIFOXYA12_FULL_35_25]OGU88005.1 MAG: hypothetical protein A2492_13560 [Ignavibac